MRARRRGTEVTTTVAALIGHEVTQEGNRQSDKRGGRWQDECVIRTCCAKVAPLVRAGSSSLMVLVRPSLGVKLTVRSVVHGATCAASKLLCASLSQCAPLTVLFSLCCSHCAVLTVLPSLCCPHCATLTVLFSLCSPHYAAPTVLISLCCSHCAALTMLPPLC